jgi:hypothetical protein
VAGVVLVAAASEPLATALLCQVRYLATLPGATGADARAELPDIETPRPSGLPDRRQPTTGEL